MANSSRGGGTDSQGRVIAAFMSQHIPGNPRVLFTNEPNKPLEYVYAATEAPKDGTYISWSSMPQLNFGFSQTGGFIKRSTFEPIGAASDPTRGWMLFNPVRNLGEGAAESCLWDYSGRSSTGEGAHGAFLLAAGRSDVSEGSPTLLANVYAAEQLDIPFRYLVFDTVHIGEIRMKLVRGDINSTIRSGFWFRLPVESPHWIERDVIRVMASMGPGHLRRNALTEPHCGDIRGRFNDDQTVVYNSMLGPENYVAKTLWLPPGTPGRIADTLAAAFEEALTTNAELIRNYAGVTGEEPRWVGRTELQVATLENEDLLEGSQAIVNQQAARLLPKYFAQYIH